MPSSMMLWFLLFGAVAAAVQGTQLQSQGPLVHTVGKGHPIKSMPNSLYYKVDVHQRHNVHEAC
jgi:hypothetical protein